MKTANILGALLGVAFSVMATASLGVTSILAFVLFAGWTAAPFLGAAIMGLTLKNKTGAGIGIYLSLVTGILAFIDIRYWHPDPQGGIAFIMLPIIFLVIIAVSMAIVNAIKHNRS